MFLERLMYMGLLVCRNDGGYVEIVRKVPGMILQALLDAEKIHTVYLKCPFSG